MVGARPPLSPLSPPSRSLVALLPLGSPPGQVAAEILPRALGEKAGGQRAESPGLCALRWLLDRGTEGAAEPFWGVGAMGQSSAGWARVGKEFTGGES